MSVLNILKVYMSVLNAVTFAAYILPSTYITMEEVYTDTSLHVDREFFSLILPMTEIDDDQCLVVLLHLVRIRKLSENTAHFSTNMDRRLCSCLFMHLTLSMNKPLALFVHAQNCS